MPGRRKSLKSNFEGEMKTLMPERSSSVFDKNPNFMDNMLYLAPIAYTQQTFDDT